MYPSASQISFRRSWIDLEGCDLPISQKGGLDSTEHGIHHNAQWQQKAGCGSWHASQGRNDSRATSKQHSCDKNVGHQAKYDEYNMSRGAISRPDNFEESLEVISVCSCCRRMRVLHEHLVLFSLAQLQWLRRAKSVQ